MKWFSKFDQFLNKNWINSNKLEKKKKVGILPMKMHIYHHLECYVRYRPIVQHFSMENRNRSPWQALPSVLLLQNQKKKTAMMIHPHLASMHTTYSDWSDLLWYPVMMVLSLLLELILLKWMKQEIKYHFPLMFHRNVFNRYCYVTIWHPITTLSLLNSVCNLCILTAFTW